MTSSARLRNSSTWVAGAPEWSPSSSGLVPPASVFGSLPFRWLLFPSYVALSGSWKMRAVSPRRIESNVFA